MLVFITHRRLRPGTFDEFRKAWEFDDQPDIRETAYHARSPENPDEIISFGLAHDLTVDDLTGLRNQIADSDRERQQRMAQYVEWTGLDAVFEVIDEVRFGE